MSRQRELPTSEKSSGSHRRLGTIIKGGNSYATCHHVAGELWRHTIG